MLLFAIPSSLSHQAFSLSYGPTQRRKLCICTGPGQSILSSSSTSFFARPVTHEFYHLKTHRLPNYQSPTAVLGGGGFLGVGPGELVVVAAVGWLLLGPEKLYAVSKDLGKLIGDLRRTANDARDSFKDALENEITTNFEASTTDSPATLSQSSERDGAPTIPDKQEDSEADPETNIDLTSATNVSTSPEMPSRAIAATPAPKDETASSIAENSAFLDQLKRVSDPRQAPPAPTLPDLNMDDPDDTDIEEDELELQRLKIQYLEARVRLQAKKKRTSEHGSNGTSPSTNGSKGNHNIEILTDRDPSLTEQPDRDS